MKCGGSAHMSVELPLQTFAVGGGGFVEHTDLCINLFISVALHEIRLHSHSSNANRTSPKGGFIRQKLKGPIKTEPLMKTTYKFANLTSIQAHTCSIGEKSRS